MLSLAVLTFFPDKESFKQIMMETMVWSNLPFSETKREWQLYLSAKLVPTAKKAPKKCVEVYYVCHQFCFVLYFVRNLNDLIRFNQHEIFKILSTSLSNVADWGYWAWCITVFHWVLAAIELCDRYDHCHWLQNPETPGSST